MADETNLPGSPEFNIHDYLDILRRRKAVLATVFVVVASVGIAATAMSTPVFRTQSRLLVPTPTMQLNIVDNNNPVSAILNATQPEDIQTQLQILQSQPFRKKAVEAAKVQPRPNVQFPTYAVEAVPETNIINVSTEGGDPAEVQRLANAVVKVHLAETAHREKSGIRRALVHLERQFEKAATALAAVEKRLVAFEEKTPLSELETNQGARSKQYIELQAALKTAERNVAVTRQEVEALTRESRETPAFIVQEQVRENPRHLRAQERLDALVLKREDLLALYKPEHAQVRAVDASIARIKALIDAEPEEVTTQKRAPNPERDVLRERLAEQQNLLSRAKMELNQAQGQLEALGPGVANLGMLQLHHSRLLDERKALKEQYEAARTLLADLKLRDAAMMDTSRVIEEAPLGAPIQPRRASTLVLSLVVALALAAAVAFLVEFIDDRIHDPEDLERQTSLPALARVPLMATDQPRLLITPLPVNSQVGEAYRALRSSIRFAAVDAPIRRILITSASKGEGKSVTALNLATMMALDGKRVILVDTDLRKPSVHHLLQLPNDTGLSEVLAGLIPLEEALQDTPVENLLALPSGPIPPNPAELLGSAAFDELVELLEEQADVLIFDSAPCLPVTDPLILAGRMDGVVLVVSVGQTRKGAVRHTEELLQRAHGRLLGLVFNRMQFKGSSYYQYYHRYYGEERPARGSRVPEAAPMGIPLDDRRLPVHPRDEELTVRTPAGRRAFSDYEDI